MPKFSFLSWNIRQYRGSPARLEDASHLIVFDKEYGGMDATTVAMKMHLKNGSITQKQFDEFLKNTKTDRESLRRA